MPSIMESRVARSRNIPYDQRNFQQTVADFYLLETLGYIKGDPVAKAKLLEYEANLAEEFASYLDIAVGGELRYAKSMLGDQCPKRLQPFLKEASLSDRGTAWLVWGVVRRAWGVDAVRLAKETFEIPGWRGAFGGDAWADIASVLLAYLEGRINDRIFVDRCFSLEHNSGAVFNKLYEVKELPPVLEAHGNDEYDTLFEHASEEVKCLWRRQEILLRANHDPVWLGNGYPYNLNDVYDWEEKFGWRKIQVVSTSFSGQSLHIPQRHESFGQESQGN